MLRRFLILALIGALSGPAAPAWAAAGGGLTLATGQVSGTARNAAGESMPNTAARLRDVRTGRLTGQSVNTTTGQFNFGGLIPGSYIVEVVNAAGQVLATSVTISLRPGAMMATGVSVTAPAVTAAAAAGSGGTVDFFTSAAGIVMLAALAGGVTYGVYRATRSSSQSLAPSTASTSR